MDSIRPVVKEYYSSRGVQIIEDDSVDLNDLEKVRIWKGDESIYLTSPHHFTRFSTQCLWQVKETQESTISRPFDTVCIYGGWGGRFDQSMSSLSALFKFRDTFKHTIMVDEDTAVKLLRPCEDDSTHIIRPAAAVEGKLCGLIPVFGPCSSVTTQGLRWNLKDDELCLGKLVSSSNEFTPRMDVSVKCNNFLAWTTQISSPASEATIKVIR